MVLFNPHILDPLLFKAKEEHMLAFPAVEQVTGEHEVAGATASGVGLAVNYNLGGGAVFQVGYGDGEGTDTMSVGLALSF